jgi:hypothetical protein
VSTAQWVRPSVKLRPGSRWRVASTAWRWPPEYWRFARDLAVAVLATVAINVWPHYGFLLEAAKISTVCILAVIAVFHR